MSEWEEPAATRAKVRWGRVGLFYAVAFGWVCLVAAGLYLTGNRNMAGAQGLSAATVVIALLYMPAPMVAALIVGRLDHRPALIRTTFDAFWRRLPRLLLVVVLVIGALLVTMLGLSWLVGNRLDINGAGRVLSTPEDLLANALLLVPSMDAAQVARMAAAMPSLWPLLGITYLAALIAGFTINGVFAFGEEYGWRGWLADELRPLGAFWANVITGVLWGLWHGPLILMGFNYGSYGRIGTLFMIAWCLPLSFLFWRARQVTGSLLAPAVLHGSLNGFAGIFLIVLVDPNPLLAAPVGLLGAAAAAVVAVGFWVFTRRWAGRAR